MSIDNDYSLPSLQEVKQSMKSKAELLLGNTDKNLQKKVAEVALGVFLFCINPIAILAGGIIGIVFKPTVLVFIEYIKESINHPQRGTANIVMLIAASILLAPLGVTSFVYGNWMGSKML